MKRNALFSVMLLAAAPSVFANTCESSFQKKGNPITGTTYTASVSHQDLTVANAIGQMRVIAKNANMDVVSEDVEAGAMLIEEPQTATRRSVPMIVTATHDAGLGTVGMMVKLSPGAVARADGVRAEMCRLLGQVQPGRAGAQLAASTPKASTVNISAATFANQLRTQHKENPAAIEPRYKGKTYAISGRVTGVLKSGGTYNAGFDVGGRTAVDFETVSITCAFAPNQAAYALALRPSERVNLVGVVDYYNQIDRVLWLKDCKGG